MTADQIRGFARAQAGNQPVIRKTLVTTDATTTDAEVLTISDNLHGVLTVVIVASNIDNDSYRAEKKVGYKNIAGVVTIGTITTVHEELGLGYAAATIVADADTIKVQVTGIAEQVKWTVEVKTTELINDLLEIV